MKSTSKKLRALCVANVLVLAFVILVSGAIPAFAFTEYDLQSDRVINCCDQDVTLLASTPAVWQAGETHTISGKLTASSSSSDGGMLVKGNVSCGTVAGLNSTINHTGGSGTTSVIVNWIFTASVTGTYTCYLRGMTRNAAGSSTSDSITAKAGTLTYLRVSSSNWQGSFARWATDKDCTLDPNACDEYGPYIHVGLNTGGGMAEYVLHSNTWTAPTSATEVILQLDAQLTSCTSGTSSIECGATPPYANKGTGIMDHAGSAGIYYPILTITSTSNADCSSYTGSGQSYSISWAQHHKKISSQTTLSIPVGSTCRKFNVKLYLSSDTTMNPVSVLPDTYSIGYIVSS